MSRLVVVFCIAFCIDLALAAGLVGVFGASAPDAGGAIAIVLVAALVPALGSALRWRSLSPAVSSMALASAAMVAGAALAMLLDAPGLVLVPVAAAAVEFLIVPRLATSLSAADPGPLGRGRVRWLWLALAVLMVVQIGRLSVFMLDSDFLAGATYPLYNPTHTCLPAYARGAELAFDTPAEVYDGSLYKAEMPADAGAAPTEIRGMEPRMGDVFQYPPPFLLLPQTVLLLSQDFWRLRALWYALCLLAVVAALFWVARATARPQAWPLSAAVLASLPILFTLQFGQAHFFTIAAAICAMIAFRTGRDAAGGFLLAASIASKLFPGILLVVLLVRKRWSALSWTAAMGALLCALTLVLYGPELFIAFFTEQLPRLVDGRAFAAFSADNEFFMANLGFSSLVVKVATGLSLEVPGALEKGLGYAYLLALFFIAVRLGRHTRAGGLGAGESELAEHPGFTETASLLALISLAAMVGTYSPSSYALGAPIWGLALVCLWRQPGPREGLLWGGAWMFLQISPIVANLPVLWRFDTLHVWIGLGAQLLSLAVLFAAAFGWLRPASGRGREAWTTT